MRLTSRSLDLDSYSLLNTPLKGKLVHFSHRVRSQHMGLNEQFAAVSGPLFALLTVLFAAALSHPDPTVRARAERLLAVIFRAR